MYFHCSAGTMIIELYSGTLQYKAIEDEEVHLFNLVGGGHIDAFSLSDSYSLGRKLIREYIKVMRENISGFENAVLTNTAETLGIREGRRIQGKYIITHEDVAEGRNFGDCVCGNCWWIDIHNPSGKGVLDATRPKGGYHDVPYRALYSDALKNLLFTGRCISSDHAALAAVRIMPTCIATGQAVGAAARLAIEENTTIQNVDINNLQTLLVKEGALISGINLN